MRIFDRRARRARHAIVAIFVLGALGAVFSCGSPTTCLRYSDCDQGLTCAFGLCVLPPVDGGDGGDDGGGGDDSGEGLADAAVGTGTPTTDSGGTTTIEDAGSGEPTDATTTDDASGIADASTD